MPRKAAKPKKSSDPEQYDRFVETARKLDADKSPEAFDKAFKTVTRQKISKSHQVERAKRPRNHEQH